MKLLLFISCFVALNSFSESVCIQDDIDFSGFCSEYYPNGKVKWIKEFQNGQAAGVWMYFDEQGNLKKQLNTNLKRDSLDKIYEETFHIDLKDTTVYEFVDQDASFKGNMLEFIVKNLNYPHVELCSLGPSLRVYIQFTVEKNGSVSNVFIRKPAINCPDCDKEALRVIKAMPPWKPAAFKNRIVRSLCLLPIGFSPY